MTERVNKYGMEIDINLYNFINDEVMPGTDIKIDEFWEGFSILVKDLSSKNKSLLQKRLDFKNKIDNWHLAHKGKNIDYSEYKAFLEDIGYLFPEGEQFKIETTNVDDEISNISGPQLVVPITNARYALNAANARWGSLYDALYGTDAMGTSPAKGPYNETRGNEVIRYAKNHLDKIFPLNEGSWLNVSKIDISENKLNLLIKDNPVFLKNDASYEGYIMKNGKLSEIILKKNGLGVRLIIDLESRIGKNDIAGISDILLESAVSTIMDCEDSVATVDGEDKVIAYKNWLGLMKGNLSTKFEKNGEFLNRSLNNDVMFTNALGKKDTLKGRSLMLIRNVGHLMTNPAIIDANGEEVYEGIIDAIFTTLIAIHDIKGQNTLKNSVTGSIYVVKPKMHGPEEVSFSDEIFTKVEDFLKIPKYSVKLGIMDEERRTSVNLYECIRAAKNRVAFINTGFLDRTGDEIHTSTEAGPFLEKGAMKSTRWINSYENRNVDIGLECGLQNKAQIGKGMWAMPDLMSEMVNKKIEHPQSGANCAWVPSPTAATLHSMHYHEVNVKEVQNNIIKQGRRGKLEDLLNIPLSKDNWNKNDLLKEVDNNAQSILGYVVRWVDQGVGCSKVPDINDIGLMEDRATCRISSQILANWLKHDLISKEEVMVSMKKMAVKVDKQNESDKNYKKMAPEYDSFSFQAALKLVLEGSIQPSGYTEPILHEMRLKLKNHNSAL